MKRIPVRTLVAFIIFVLVTINRYYNEDDAGFAQAKTEMQAQYLESDIGSTRFRVFGHDNRPTVVLIHGFNGYLESWEPNIEPLVRSGYRVIAYDMWGRGLTSRPRVDLDLGQFRAQLASLIQYLGARNVVLMGSSFGCVVATDYALNYPDQVEKLVLIGPAGWPSPNDSHWLNFPLLADVVFHYFGKFLLRPKVEAYFYKEKSAWALNAWDRYASYPGFTRSALSTLRHSPVTDYTEGWAKLGAVGKPTLFVWGKQDVTFPYANKDRASELIPHARIVGIDNAAHWVNIEKSDEVNSIVLAFLNGTKPFTARQ